MKSIKIINKIKNKYISMPITMKAALWFTICGFIQKGMGFITVPIFTRILSTQQYGIVSVFYSWESIFVIFCTLNLYSGVFNNGMVKFENDRNGFTSSMQGLVIVLTSIVSMIYILFHGVLSQALELQSLLMIMMFFEIIFNASFSLWSSKERFEYKYKKMVLITILITILSPLVSAIAVFNAPPNYGADTKIISSAIVGIIIYGYIFIENFIKGKKFFNKIYWKYALKFNLPLIPHYLSTLLLAQSDRIMISKLIGMAEAGIYGLSHNLAMILNILTTSVNNTFAPWLYMKLKEKKYDNIANVSNKLFAVIAIALGLLIGISPEVIRILAPVDYYNAVYVIPPLAISLYFMFMYQIFANVEFYYEKNKFIALASVMSALFNIILNYFFVKHYGYIAAGYTTLFCYIILGLSHYIFSKKIIKNYIGENVILFELKSILLIGLILIIFGIIMIGLYKILILRYLILLAICIFSIAKRNFIITIIKNARKD